MAPPHFCQLKARQAEKTNYIKNREAMCLSEKWVNYVYKKVEGEIINVNTLKQEFEQELDREDDNLYKKVVLNKVYIEVRTKPHKWKIGPYLLTKSNMCIIMKGPHTDLTCTL